MNLIQRLLAKMLPLETVIPQYAIRSGKPLYRDDSPEGLVRHYKNWVYVCASRNAAALAQVPLKLYVRGKTSRYERRGLDKAEKKHLERVTGKAADDVEEIVDGHPALELLGNVNPHMTQFELKESLCLSLDLTGDAYWYIENGPLGVPQYIWPMLSQYTKVVPDPKNFVRGYLYGRDPNTAVALDYDEVVHCKYPNPRNLFYGMSPLEGAFGAVALTEAAQEYQQALFDNRAIPDTVIQVKTQISEDERKRLYAEWNRRHRGAKNAGGVQILQGDTEVATLGFPPADTGIEISAKFSREEIAAAFGVPMTLLEMSSSNKASASEGNYAYMQYAIAPRCVRIAETLTEQLAQRYYDDRLFFAFDDPVPDDNEYMLKERQTNITVGFTSVNEERAKAGLDPIPGEEYDKPRTMGMPPQAQQDAPPDKQPTKTKGMMPEEVSFMDAMTGWLEDTARDVDKVMRDAEGH